MTRELSGLVARALLYPGRILARAARGLNYLAAGTLTIDGLREGIERTWEDFNARDADVGAGLTRLEEEMVARFLTRDDDVLIVGSGPGRDLVALCANGYRVTGLEPARRAVAICRHQLEKRGLTADVIEGFFEDAALPRRFDAIVFSGCCYSFMPDSRRRVVALRKASSHLAPGGRIVIDCMSEPPEHPALIRLTRVAAVVTRSDWHPEDGDVLLPLHTSRPLFHYEHRFAPGELEAEAHAAGLRVVHRCDVPNAPLAVLEPAVSTTARS
jgi:SAM-dependent methyltransferase